MELLTSLKIAHVLATLLLLGSALGLALWVWLARRKGDSDVHTRILQRPLVFVWLLMGVSLVSMPFTGWWLVHLIGWPLGQTWVLGSSLIYTVGAFCWFWLSVRLNRLRTAPGAGNPKVTLGLAVFCAVCFIAIAGLMGAKPV